MAGLRVVICSYNMLGIWVNVGQTRSRHSVTEIKTQSNLTTSRGQMCMEAEHHIWEELQSLVAAQYYRYTWWKNLSTSQPNTTEQRREQTNWMKMLTTLMSRKT